MSKVIKYIGFYDTNNNTKENRNTFLAATNKMNYIASSIVKAGYSVDIISPSWSKNSNGYYKSRVDQISPKVRLIIGSTFGGYNRLIGYLRILWSWIYLFYYLLFNIEKNEKIIVYHSIMLIYPVLLAKKLKQFKMILEVEEIYQDVSEFSEKVKQNEYKMFDNADMFLFSTELLNNKLNNFNKPYAIVYGTYKTEKRIQNNFWNDNKIHLVYAGIIDRIKGGAFETIQSALYLSDKYYIHIIGFGSENDINTLKLLISEISNKTSCKISYDGILKGTEYISFLQKCHIGLSTQVPDEKYINTSFPSKILSYLSNNLRVISMKIPCVEQSAIGSLVWYYDDQNPECIARTIESVNLSEEYNSMAILNSLNNDFIKDISKMLNN